MPVPEKPEFKAEDIRAIADLARLSLSDDEVAMYSDQLSAILDYFTMLQELDTDNVEATASVLPLRSVMREDEAIDGLAIEDVVANAPAADDRQFRVSPVLDNE